MRLTDILWLLPVAVLAAPAAQPSPSPRPNIIFILADDLGHGDIGVFHQNQRERMANRSKPWHRTPHIDRLAAEGVTLPQHYCAAPVCAPSRASLLSGLHQGHANVRDNQFDKALEQNHNLATVLKAAGYGTACIGKWGLAGLAPEWPGHPLVRGFDSYFGGLEHVAGHEHYPKEGPHRGPKPILDGRQDVSAGLDKCYTTDLFTARAKHWIGEHVSGNAGKPFFLYLAYATPHAVLELPTQAYPTGGGSSGGLQWLGKPGQMINTASGEIDSWIHPDYANATWDHDKDSATPEIAWPNVYQRYATSVRRIDDCVGDLLQQLKDLNIDRETLVIFTSDNGPSVESYLKEPYSPAFFGSYGPHSGIKRDGWEGGIRVGAIARWPASIPANRRSNLPCGHVDWLATFADMAGVPPPARTDGRSLLPALTGIGTQRVPTVYIEHFTALQTPNFADFPIALHGRKRGQMQILRKGDLSAIRLEIAEADDDFEIYNVVTDPRQTTNLAAKHPELQKQCKADVLGLRRPLDDAIRPYDQALVPGVMVPHPVPGNLDYKIYQGSWPWLPDFGTLVPAATGRASGTNLNTPGDGVRFSGYFRAPADGEYTFHMKAGAAAQLRIHQALVIDDDFNHDGSWRSATICLEAGLHPMQLDARTPQGSALELECSGPELVRQAVVSPERCAAGS